MPRLSDSMEEGTIVAWLVADGSVVHRGEPIAEIETDKATMEYEADADGVITFAAAEGDTLPIGAAIAHVTVDGETTPAAEMPASASDEGPSTSHDDVVTDLDGQPLASDHDPELCGTRPTASPYARKVAAERGVALDGIDGRGPGGRIVAADVPQRDRGTSPAADPEPAVTPDSPGGVTVQQPTRIQMLTAKRMGEATHIPDFQVMVTVDMTAAGVVRAQIKRAAQEAGRRPPSVNDLIVKACAMALRDHPKVNGAWRDGTFELYDRVNVGVAVAGPDSLVVPVVQDADQISVGEIARRTGELAAAVRDAKITPQQLSGATFTVSNLGMFGIDRFVAVLNPPQAAILACGAVVQRPAVLDGQVAVRDLMDLTLTCDHRILDGAHAVRFLTDVRALLQAPMTLLAG